MVNLVVSQINDCAYCLAAHTAIGKMNGFDDAQILDIRRGSAPFDAKLDALTKFVKDATVNRSKPSDDALDGLFAAGYTKANLVDILMVIGDKTVSNFIHGSTKVLIDFPAALALESVAV